MKKIKTLEQSLLSRRSRPSSQSVLSKNIVFIPIKSVSASITIPIQSVCDNIPIKSVSIESIEFVENSFHYNMISGSAYLLALNVFISEIGKETLNNKELK